MNIGIFTELYPPSIGGQEIRFAELAQVFRERGHSVSVYCIAHRRDLLKQETLSGVEVHRFPVDEHYQRPQSRLLPRNPVTILKYATWVRGVLKARSFDLSLFNQWPLAHIALAPRRARQGAVLDWCEVREARFYRFMQWMLPRLSGQNMGVGPAVCDRIGAASGRPVFYLPSGIRRSAYRSLPAAERRDILYLGRITAHKNLTFLIDAFARLKAAGHNRAGSLGDDELVIAGDGPALPALRAHAAASPAAGQIRILGPVSEQQKIDLLGGARLLAIPSRREGFPRIVAEAMASGLPTVTARFAENGTGDVVDHYGCGIVTEPEMEAFTGGLITAADRWEELSWRGLSRADELDWQALAEQLEARAVGGISNVKVQDSCAF
ncbi:glycosyltransferase family 4 protein [Mycobacterium sp. KBS0706]|uniref:glycosyltransferase family 4 protein n=1 Tax=Mycobacterium sp. KBS0706 TaxID=2578109 RepID=UPI00110FA39E|nr:glycosyltransferase family 4 protein [Mycobacterium sp. KBS0706]TSD86536.1 glycosyltransferase family 4 protein [Mycobacterium sp. KBS0706]